MASSASYSPIEQPFLADKDGFDSNEELTIGLKCKSRHCGGKFTWADPWVLSTAFFATTTMLLFTGIVTARLVYLPSPAGNFETGFSTDLEAAKPWIEAKRVRFTGMLKFHENGSMYREYPEDQPLYVGPPSPEIDEAWNDLLFGSAVDLPTELAGHMTEMTWEEPQGDLWRTGLDVFHQLHCVDYIRRAFHPEYYGKEDLDQLFDMHRDHCLDYIRQGIMCNGDATPVMLRWRKQSHFLIPHFDGYHTCRNFDLLHDFSKKYALERHNDENQRLIDHLVEIGDL